MPEVTKVELEIGVKEDSSIAARRATTLELARQQRLMMEAGAMNAQQVAHSKLVIDVEAKADSCVSCQCRLVHHLSPTPHPCRAMASAKPEPVTCMGGAFDYELRGRRGNRAMWLEKHLTADDDERFYDEFQIMREGVNRPGFRGGAKP